MEKNLKNTKGGFTLIEILIVIGIIAILAAIVLVAVNPAKNFRDAANAQRGANINAIINAIGQYTVDEKGKLPPGLEGVSDFGPDRLDGTNSSDEMANFDDLCNALVPKYIGAFPADPDEADQAITGGAECNDADTVTGYEIELNDGRITISAPGTVDPEDGSSAEALFVTR